MRSLDVSALMEVLQAHWVFALATADEHGVPYLAPLFYAVLGRSTPRLVFTTDPKTLHGAHLGTGPTIAAGAIYREDREIDDIRGVQLRGLVRRDDVVTPEEKRAMQATYVERHPLAAPMLERGRHRLFTLDVTWAKLTDNAQFGLGKHRVWEKP